MNKFYVKHFNFKPLIGQALEYIQHEKYDSALQLLEEARTMAYQYEFDDEIKAMIYAMKSTCYMYLSDEPSAFETLKKSISLSYGNSETLSNYALLLNGRSLYNEAIEYSKAAIKIDKNEINAYLNLGNSYIALNDRISALKWYQKGFKNNPEDELCSFNLIMLELSLGLFNQAENHIKELKNRNPKSIITYYVYISFYLEHCGGLTHEQQTELESYINIFTANTNEGDLVRLLTGIFYFNFRSVKDGIGIFVELIKSRIKHPAPYLYVSRIFYSKGDYELCEKYYKLALQYKDYSYSIIRIHESIYFKLSKYQCLPGLESAIEYTKAAIEYHKQNYGVAVSIFRKALFNINRDHTGIINKSKIRVFRFRSSTNENIEAAIDNTLWFSDLSMFNDSFEGELLSVYERADHFYELLRNFKACCFFECDNGYVDSRMWDLYANKCNGFCMEYEIDLIKFSQVYDVFIDKITYSNHYYQDITSLLWMIHNCFFRKASSWKDEKEIRVLFYDDTIRSGVKIPLEKLCMKLTNIYFGYKMSSRRISTIYERFKDSKIGLSIVEPYQSSFDLYARPLQIYR